jgi:hypothetical protein
VPNFHLSAPGLSEAKETKGIAVPRLIEDFGNPELKIAKA